MRRLLGTAGIACLVAGAFALGLFLTRAHAGDPVTPLAAGPRDTPPSILDEVRRELVDGYYRPVSARQLAGESVDEVVRRLDDPYTEHLTPGAYLALKTRTASTYSGVGLTLRPGKGGLVVKTAMQGPAREAGIRRGDLIVSVDGRALRQLRFERSLELLRGERGTTVDLTVRRPREGKLNFSVARSDIALPTVRSRLLRQTGGRVAYVKLLSFRANAAASVDTRVSRLRARGAEGVVLDLRGNPGGLLSQAVGTVSLFVDSGLVCVTEGVHHGRREYAVAGGAAHADVPLVVLVDEGSASAAEVVAAALEDHDRAVVVGRPTYGKATVQSIRELSDGSALKLTTAVFQTPNGIGLTHAGLTPEVAAEDLPETMRDEALRAAAQLLVERLDAEAA